MKRLKKKKLGSDGEEALQLALATGVDEIGLMVDEDEDDEQGED